MPGGPLIPVLAAVVALLVVGDNALELFAWLIAQQLGSSHKRSHYAVGDFPEPVSLP